MNARHHLPLLLLLSSCAAHTIIPLTVTTPYFLGPSAPMEITTRSVAVQDPLPIRNSSIAFTSIEALIRRAMISATAPFAVEHAAQNPDGWQMLVELWQARAEKRGPQTKLVLGIRATLRSRDGNRFIAQTQVHCEKAALIAPAQAAPVFYECVEQLGHELSGWLNGIDP